MNDEIDPVERDTDLAWELYDARPTHPEIARLATRVLAQRPWRSGIRILLAKHRRKCGSVDEARRILQDVLGRRDRFFTDAARELRDLELYECRFDKALEWAETVLREDQEYWKDRLELGIATAMSGELADGWRLLDDAVEMCARTSSDELRFALAGRTIYLMQSFAPPERFIAAAEETMRVDPSNEYVGGPLVWAYVHEGRWADAEELALRLLRIDPTDGVASGALTMIRELREIAAKRDVELADVHEAGVITLAWEQMRDRMLGTDLRSALAALDEVMPAELREVLRPPLGEEEARESPGSAEIAAWHDGQLPGTGTAWGADGAFRLMSAAEVQAMDDAIEADPETYRQWQQSVVADYYSQIFTDDAGGYLIAVLDGLVIRRFDAEDERLPGGLNDWFWDRVAAFGGRDPRPVVRREAVPSTEN